jgi:hypothetical protein
MDQYIRDEEIRQGMQADEFVEELSQPKTGVIGALYELFSPRKLSFCLPAPYLPSNDVTFECLNRTRSERSNGESASTS